MASRVTLFGSREGFCPNCLSIVSVAFFMSQEVYKNLMSREQKYEKLGSEVS